MAQQSPSFNLRERDLSQDATELPRRFPLVIDPENRSGSTNKDARLINCYVEKNKKTNQYKLFGRPGILVNATYSLGTPAAGLGMFNWKGDIYTIFASVIYKNGSSHGTGLNTAGGRYRFDVFLSPSRLLFKNTAAAYITDGATVTQITDPDFPATTVPGWGFLDATEYVATPSAAIQGSDLNAPNLYDPLNTLTAQIEPDNAVALTKQLAYIVLLKQWSTEVFYDAGNATGSPLGRVQGSKADYGCISAATLADAGGNLYWIGTYQKGDQAMRVSRPVKMDNLKVQEIGTPPVDRLLEAAVYTDSYSFTLGINGHQFYVVTMPTTNLTMVYDTEENIWSQWTDASGNYFPYSYATGGANQDALLQHESNGNVYNCSMSYVNDNGSVFQKDVITPNFDGGVRWIKQLQRLEAVGDQTSGSIIGIRSNDYDYASDRWTNWRYVDMGDKRPYLQDCGSFIRRAYHVRQKTNAAFYLEGIEMTINMGVSG